MTASAIPPAIVADAAAAAKAWLRAADGADTNGDGATIASLAHSAIVLAEAWCGLLFAARGVDDAVPACGGWQPLPAAPVTAIGSVAALASDGTETPLLPADYAIDIDAGGTGWVRATRSLNQARLLVGYQAGLAAAWDDVPSPVAQGVAMMAAHLFDHREGDAVPPAAVAALWRPWRRTRLAAGMHR